MSKDPSTSDARRRNGEHHGTPPEPFAVMAACKPEVTGKDAYGNVVEVMKRSDIIHLISNGYLSDRGKVRNTRTQHWGSSFRAHAGFSDSRRLLVAGSA